MRGGFHRLIDLTGRTIGRRLVLARAPSRSKAGDAWWRVRCACGREQEVNGNMLRRGTAKACRWCARKAPHFTRQTMELLVLAAEHPALSVVLVRDELGVTARAAWAALQVATRKGLIAHPTKGVYQLAPAGLALLRDVAEGRARDRWRVRREIVAALDGGRASGRRTLRGAA